MNLNFFQVVQSAALLKKEKKALIKKDVSHLETASHSKIQKKNIEKRERKMKNKKKSINNDKYFFTVTLLYRKMYILLEHAFGKN